MDYAPTAYELEQEWQRQIREKEQEDDYNSQFNTFSPLSLGNNYERGGLSDNSFGAESNSDNSSSPVRVETLNQGVELDSLTGTLLDEAVVEQLPEYDTPSFTDSFIPGAETLAQQQIVEEEEIELPFPVSYPIEAVEAALEQADNPPPVPPQEVIPPIFQGYSPPVNEFEKNDDGELIQGAELIFEKELFEIVEQAGQQSFTFYWQSNDSILGRIEATIDTGGASGMERKYIEGVAEDDPLGRTPRPPRLVFTGSGGGAQFYGNVIFGTYNRMVIDVVKDGRRVRYLQEGKEANRPCTECRNQGSGLDAERGEFVQTETDLYIEGRSGASAELDYSFSRHYRSRLEKDTTLGNNWEHNYFERLERQIDGSIVHNNGLDREDRYCRDEDGNLIPPSEFFTSLEENEDGSFTLREADGTVRSFNPDGNLTEIRDRNDNFVTLKYEQGKLSQFIDTMGRVINYEYINDGSVNDGRLDKIVDFIGREVKFSYDGNGDLEAVTSPVVDGTPNGNDFKKGKTTHYTYSSGFSDPRLNHNLISIIRPNEVAEAEADPDPDMDEPTPVLVNTYGTSGFALDKVVTQTYGGTNDSEVDAGGTFIYQYTLLATGDLTGDPNQPISRFTETDRNGNITEYEFNPLGYTIAQREFTKGLREGEPEFFETIFKYNADGRLLEQTDPEGNIMPYTYDFQNSSRFAEGNLLVSRQLPDDRGGDQDQITTLSLYEPIYQQVSLSIDPRGLDPDFEPPIPEPSGRSQFERYSTRSFFDYQEAAPDVILPLLADELGVSIPEVQELLDAAGVQLGLGDLNGDDVISTSIAGNVVATVGPSVVLLPDSNQLPIEGDPLQDIFTLYRYNQFGQMTSMVDAEGNVHLYEYFAENDPDGDGILTSPPADGRVLDTETGGYLEEEIRDFEHVIIDGHPPNNGSGAEPTAISMQYEYDPVGNIIGEIDGRGIRTKYVVNELDQVVRTIRAFDVPNLSVDEPLPLTAFAYIEDVEYDFNDNVVKRSIEDRGNTSNTGGFVEYEYIYDILDNLVTETQEVDVDTTLVTQYRYDANENLTFTLYPEGNATSAIYDERDLLFVNTRGAFEAPAGTLSPPPPTNPDPDPMKVEARPYDVRGGIPCQCTTYNYDGNRNVIEMVDSDDTDLSDGNNGKIGGTIDEEGDLTRFVYDGYDRQVATIDAVGNKTEVNYDPVSNVITQRVFGPIGGESPKNNNGVDNVLLSEMFYLHDELNRQYQSDYNLFVANGVSPVRIPDLTDGSLTPGDNKVTTRTEYDRKSRVTFSIEDDEDTTNTQNEGTSRIDYDGADRQIKTTDAEGNMVEFAYDDNNNLIETKETDVSQITGIDDEIFLTTYFYDSLNRLQQTTDNIGQTMFYRYDSRDNLVAMADAQGPVTGATIDRRAFSEGALTVNTINDFGNVTRYFYDGINRKIQEEQILTASGEGDGINIGATLEGIKTTTPTPDPNQGGGDGIIRTGYVYDDNSLLSALLDDQGNITLYLYDNLNRQVTETKGLVITSPFTETFILGDRRVVTPTAATINNPKAINDPENKYDGKSRLQEQMDDAKDRIDKIAHLFQPLADDVPEPPDVPPPPQATTIVYGYDPDDNVLILEDENDSETFTKYDAINRAIAVRVFRSEGNPPTRDPDDFSNDPIFDPQPENDFEGPHRDEFPPVIGTNHNNYEYDGLSRLTLATDNNDPGDDPMNPFDDPSDDSTVTYAYDSLSRVIEEVQQIGPPDVASESTGSNTLTTLNDNTQTWVADEWVAKLVKITKGKGEGQIREVIANTSSELTINRDWDEIPDGNSEYEILPAKAISSAYEADTRSSVIYPNGRKLNYTYDSLDRLQSITDEGAAEAIVEYDYIGVGRVLERRSPTNDTRMTYLNDTGDADTGYDGLRRITQLRHLRDADDSLIVGFEYDYDRMNNRVSQIKLHDPNRSEFYTYDSVYRLIEFERPDSSGNDWTLDGVGNWQEVDGETREHSSFNEIISRQDGVTEDLRYDDNGNLIEDGEYLYEWDSRNRLRVATRKADGEVAVYSYDALGRRIRKDVSNSGNIDIDITDFYYDGNRVVEERDGNDVLT